MAGLAMVQMDANTENQIQVLSETDMITTQGAAPQVTECTEASYVYDGGFGPKSWLCNSSDCENLTDIDSGLVYSFKQDGFGYDWCMGQANLRKNCEIWPTANGVQVCALVKLYWGHDCDEGDKWKFWKRKWITTNWVGSVLRDEPCSSS